MFILRALLSFETCRFWFATQQCPLQKQRKNEDAVYVFISSSHCNVFTVMSSFFWQSKKTLMLFRVKMSLAPLWQAENDVSARWLRRCWELLILSVLQVLQLWDFQNAYECVENVRNISNNKHLLSLILSSIF